MTIKFYNTLTRKKEDFEPVKENEILMYNCGPTVYDYAHIGNFRAYIFADVLRRYLEYKGFKVKQVVNLTDVGHLTEDEVESGIDKMQKAAEREKKSVWDIADFYIKAFIDDWKMLNLKEPTHRPRATEYISEMIEITKKLIEKGYAYEKNGSVYFEVEKFKDYGKLSGNTLEKLQAGRSGRVEHNPDKKNQLDFALWVNDPNHIMKWESPWSTGYPGWHIECSVMAFKLLGETIDFHTGGEDNIFPHHESEIAQAEAATGKKFVNFWMHTRHLMVNGEKMAKRTGNFFTPRDLVEKGFSPKAMRYLLLSSQYRSPMNLTFDGLKDMEKTVDRMIEFIDKLDEVKNGEKNNVVEKLVENVITKFEAAMDDDLNTPLALAAIHDFIGEINKLIANKEMGENNAVEVKEVMKRFDSVLGVLEREREEVPEEVQKLLEERKEAREKKDFQKADELREKIRKLSWEVQDTESGQKLRKRI